MCGKSDVFIIDGLALYQRSVFQMAVDSDALTKTFCENCFGLHVKQLILQRRTSRIDNEYFHDDFLSVD